MGKRASERAVKAEVRRGSESGRELGRGEISACFTIHPSIAVMEGNGWGLGLGWSGVEYTGESMAGWDGIFAALGEGGRCGML